MFTFKAPSGALIHEWRTLYGYFIYNSNPDGELNKSKVIHSLYNKM